MTTRRTQSAERLAGGQLIQRQMPRAEHCQPFILGAADVKEKSVKFKKWMHRTEEENGQDGFFNFFP